MQSLLKSSDLDALHEAYRRAAKLHTAELITGRIKDPQETAFLRGVIYGLHEAQTLPITITRKVQEHHDRTQRAADRRTADADTLRARQHLGSEYFWG